MSNDEPVVVRIVRNDGTVRDLPYVSRHDAVRDLGMYRDRADVRSAYVVASDDETPNLVKAIGDLAEAIDELTSAIRAGAGGIVHINASRAFGRKMSGDLSHPLCLAEWRNGLRVYECQRRIGHLGDHGTNGEHGYWMSWPALHRPGENEVSTVSFGHEYLTREAGDGSGETSRDLSHRQCFSALAGASHPPHTWRHMSEMTNHYCPGA